MLAGRLRSGDYRDGSMSKRPVPKRGVTPPKGRPTRPRHARFARRRVFGARLQWAAAVALLLVAFAILFLQFN